MACTGCKKKKESVEEILIDTSVINDSKFRLRNVLGAIQMSFGSGQFVSNANITDELAVEFLKVNPNRISMFEVYPENWKDLINPNDNRSEKSND